MAQRDGNKQRGWVNYFRVLAGGYLLYLAYRLMRGLWDGTAENVLLNGAAGAVFAAAGAVILWREWKHTSMPRPTRTTRIPGPGTTLCRKRQTPTRTRTEEETGREGRGAVRRRAGGALLQ